MMTGSPLERLAELAQLWRVTIGRMRTTPGSIVAFGFRDDAPVLLKVSTHPHEEWRAGELISAFAGRGMVRALEHAPGAVLLEEMKPATPLARVIDAEGDERAVHVLASVIAAMQETSPAVRGFPSAQEWGRSFERYLASNNDEIPVTLVVEAQRLYEHLCRTQAPPRLLHGDLHHDNVLLDAGRGWLAIDPKGVVAELEFELGAALRNPAEMPVLYTPGAIERRAKAYARQLDLDAGRIVQWTFAQAVLSAIWITEDGGLPAADNAGLQVAVSAREMLV